MNCIIALCRLEDGVLSASAENNFKKEYKSMRVTQDIDDNCYFKSCTFVVF